MTPSLIPGSVSGEAMVERVRDAIYDAASGPESLGISDALAEKFARAALSVSGAEEMREALQIALRLTVAPSSDTYAADVEKIRAALSRAGG